MKSYYKNRFIDLGIIGILGLVFFILSFIDDTPKLPEQPKKVSTEKVVPIIKH